DAGWMELHELHVLQGETRAKHEAAAVAGAGVRRGSTEIRATITAGREHDPLRTEQVQRAFGYVEREHASADARVVPDQVECRILDHELRIVRERLLVQREQHRVTGTIGCRARALRGRTFAVLRGHAAEWALIDP